MVTPPCLLLLGAGAAGRMRGRDKLLEPVDGVPLLRLLCERGLAADLDVRVTVPELDHPRAAALEGLDITLCDVPDRAEGMAASLRRGLEGLQAPSVLILPADMPEITSADLRHIAEHPGKIVRATTVDGAPGHPVRFDVHYYTALRDLRGDTGAKAVLKANAADVVTVALPARHAVVDLDTPEDWATWRADRNRDL